MEEKEITTTQEQEVVETTDTDLDDKELEEVEGVELEEDLDDDDFDFEDSEEVKEEPKTKKVQSKEENAKRAQERRTREAKEREKRDKDFFNRGLLEGIGGINPYTNKKIEDDDDLEIYQNMRDAEKAGFEPIEEYSDYLKHKKKVESAEQSKKDSESKLAQEKAQKDFDDFSTKYPNVDIQTLLKDEDFMDYADGKLGNKSLSDIYSKYMGYQDKIKKEAKLMAKRYLAKKKSSVGNRSEEGEKSTTSKYSTMSDEDFEKMLAKARSGELSKR